MNNIKQRNNENYAFTDREINTLLDCLEKKDPNKKANNVFVGIAVSDTKTSPISTSLKPLLQQANTSYPRKYYAPYKLANQWHWNVLEVIEEKDQVSCCRYNTDGYKYRVELPIFVEIQNCFPNKKLINMHTAKESFGIAAQDKVNCGLISALTLHDLATTGKFNYGGYKKEIQTNQFSKLREQISSLVEEFADPQQIASFCKPLDESTFVKQVDAFKYDEKDTNQQRIYTALHNYAQENPATFKDIYTSCTENEDDVGNLLASWRKIIRITTRASSPTSVALYKESKQPDNSFDKHNLDTILFQTAALEAVNEHAIDIVKLVYDETQAAELTTDNLENIGKTNSSTNNNKAPSISSLSTSTVDSELYEEESYFSNTTIIAAIALAGIAIAFFTGGIGLVPAIIAACVITVCWGIVKASSTDDKLRMQNLQNQPDTASLQDLAQEALSGPRSSSSIQATKDVKLASILSAIEELTPEQKVLFNEELEKKPAHNTEDLITIYEKATIAYINKIDTSLLTIINPVLKHNETKTQELYKAISNLDPIQQQTYQALVISRKEQNEKLTIDTLEQTLENVKKTKS